MSSVLRDTVEGHKETAVAIQSFMWEGKPFKSPKKRTYSGRIRGVLGYDS